MMQRLPWDWLQSFIIVAKAGSLSKAAKELNTSQPTLSRHVAGLEKMLGFTLFDRSTQGLKLTHAATKLIESSENMQQAAEQFSRIASGENISLDGNIRISANEIIGLYYLPEIIVEFNKMYPGVNVEIDISNKATSLNKRDADIALRMFRPSQPDLIIKRLPDIRLNIIASKDYLLENPEPKTMEEFQNHKLIGFDREVEFIKQIEQLGLPISLEDFTNRTDFLPMQVELARKGAGITVSHQYLLQQFQELTAILPSVPIQPLEFWLVCHADVQHNRRIRIMMDFLSEHLKAKLRDI